MKREKKKTPNDYPLLAFRISKADKDELMTLIEAVRLKLNKTSAKDQKKLMKNDIAVEALKRGLKAMKGGGIRWSIS